MTTKELIEEARNYIANHAIDAWESKVDDPRKCEEMLCECDAMQKLLNHLEEYAEGE